jgi:ferric-dicitrate binding protein FerR (iron transport regulator)
MTGYPYSQKILELGEKWMNGTITEEEKTVLFNWYDQFDDSELTLDPKHAGLFRHLKQDMLKDIRQKLGRSGPVGQMPGRPGRVGPMPGRSGRIRQMPTTRQKAAMAAAALVLLIAGGWYYSAHKGPDGSPAISAASKTTGPAPGQDILPGSDKATLTLGDGSSIVLDSAKTGSLALQGNSQVLKKGDGQLQYTPNSVAASAVSYNVLSTPRGGQYKLTLQDGTGVWLNAGSSIRYPTAFEGKERRVEITGEAYFEIAKNAAMPFRVMVDGSAQNEDGLEIEVLGTQFNVNAYKDEPGMKTTLVEGSVRLVKGRSSSMLRPYQQALVSPDGGLKTMPLADVEQIIAWKNGAFEFDDADISTVMRQISRWYDVEVVYEGKAPTDHFSGRFSRRTSLAGVLKILNISGIQLIAENKKIILKS